MTQATTVRRDGDTFQARLFWLKAAKLLDPQSPVLRVGFETGPKGFDDIWVEYEPGRGPGDQQGNPLRREHLQCKWHVTPQAYGYLALTDPEFINANARSLLQRAFAAHVEHAPDGTGSRFGLVTNWPIAVDDELRPLVSQRSATLRLDRLFGRGTDRSAPGRVRKAWREHLQIDEARLRVFVQTLALSLAAESLDDLRERLDPALGIVGLRRMPASDSSFVYDDLVFQWLAQGRLHFDRESFRDLCARERLLGPASGGPLVFGVKSFEHPIDRLEDRCVKVLNLVPRFDQRYIQAQEDWAEVLYPQLTKFLLAAAREHEGLRLVLDAHTTLAFAAGSVLNVKSGRRVELEQRTLGRQVWAADDTDDDPQWPTWTFVAEPTGTAGDAVAVAVSATHEIANAVKAHVAQERLDVGRILIAHLSSGANSRAVASGRHAFKLAESLAACLKAERENGARHIHLFVAAPNALTFFLGQRQMGMGRVTLYEFDFEGNRSASYERSLSLPI